MSIITVDRFAGHKKQFVSGAVSLCGDNSHTHFCTFTSSSYVAWHVLHLGVSTIICVELLSVSLTGFEGTAPINMTF